MALVPIVVLPLVIAVFYRSSDGGATWPAPDWISLWAFRAVAVYADRVHPYTDRLSVDRRRAA